MNRRQDRRKADRVERSMAESERMDALRAMAKRIAHDLKNHLQPILGFSSLLLSRREILADPEKAQRYIETINAKTRETLDLLERLGLFYRDHTQGETAGRVDLDRIVHESIGLVQSNVGDRTAAGKSSIAFVSDLNQSCFPAGEEYEFREIVMNLLLNAVEAIPEGGTVKIRTHRDGRHVVLEVSDTGVGMNEETCRHCQEPFFSGKGGKPGLGLSIVHGIVRRYRGVLEIAGNGGSGTSVTTRFPIPADGTQKPSVNDAHRMGANIEK